jgi:uncharacterized protein YprB with RNaseH-like and TPR domain
LDLLALLETRTLARDDADPALPPLDLTRLEATERRRRERDLENLARAAGARLVRFQNQRLLVLRRRHDPVALDELFRGSDRAVPDVLARYTGAREFLQVAGSRLLFLDTETTGLSHGAGTFAFVIGLATLAPDAVVSTRLFVPEPADEPLAFRVLLGFLARHPYLVTFNGKSFDLHILRNRLLLHYPWRHEQLDPRLVPHLDLLHLARRLWKHRLLRVTLQDVERGILGLERHDDVAGSLIPAIYFDFLHRGELDGVVAVLEHNLKDVLSMVALLEDVGGRLLEGRYRDPGEALGVARLMLDKGMEAQAAELLATPAHIPDREPARSAWEAAVFRVLKRRAIPKETRRAFAARVADEFPGNVEFGRLAGKLR